jgi:hypothetical protein
VSKKLILIRDGDTITGYCFWCPACETLHRFNIAENPDRRPVWNFNGDVENPTFQPSLLVHASSWQSRCHLFVSAGQIQYCPDSGHTFAGKTIDLPEIPRMSDETQEAPASSAPDPGPEIPLAPPETTSAPQAAPPKPRPLAEDECFVEFADGTGVRGKFVKWHPAREGFLQIVVTEEN